MSIEERNEELKRLEDYFATTALPEAPIILEGSMTLNNIRTFVEVNLLRAKGSIALSSCDTCIQHLQQLESYIQRQSSLR